jgi:hypothetical protein
MCCGWLIKKIKGKQNEKQTVAKLCQKAKTAEWKMGEVKEVCALGKAVVFLYAFIF